MTQSVSISSSNLTGFEVTISCEVEVPYVDGFDIIEIIEMQRQLMFQRLNESLEGLSVPASELDMRSFQILSMEGEFDASDSFDIEADFSVYIEQAQALMIANITKAL